MFHASLVNEPFGDPGVYLELRYQRAALLFDLGDLHALPPRKLLKIGHVFISHTHMDHFIGFDQLLRVSLGRNSQIRLFGPPGIIRNVENRIGSYTWNLVHNYRSDFSLSVTEMAEDGSLRSRRYPCRTAFAPEGDDREAGRDGLIAEERFFFVRSVWLDHQTPSLAFRWEERRRINIKKSALEGMGLPPGPWLLTLKEMVLAGLPDGTPVRAWWKGEGGLPVERQVSLGELRERVVLVTPGRRIAYVTDALFSERNAERIVELAAAAEILFIEAPFLERDRRQAGQKYHLTARQAGILARRAGVKRLQLFHFSPKYRGAGDRLRAEALAAFNGDKGQGSAGEGE